MDRKQLQEIAACPDASTARRARMLLMTSEGLDTSSDATALGTSERTVRSAMKRFCDGGADVLMHYASPGRPRSVSEEQRELLTSLIRRSPREFGIDSEGWSITALIAVARNESLLSDLSHWTLRLETQWIVDSRPELRDRVDMPDQKRAGAPRGNHNALRHGACAGGKPSAEELTLLADVEARFLEDFPDAQKDDTQLIRAAARACLMLNRALDSDSADAAMRLDRRLRKAIKRLKIKSNRCGNELKITPAEWPSELVSRFREA